ncbi:unnamed protein product [Mytilus edulis]|uniref:TLDc domain-containing protein n=1 Tax=Mytilus edulis TaxID=6550 RepID=A0A8S3Q6T9_MYTED|nr:unnamed protein product [Mytilus edulis]
MPEINKVDQKQLSEWITGRHKYTLLFKASRDGCVATTFHSKCNNKGATVTVLLRNANAYSLDNKAFLFRLYQDGTFKPVNFPVTGAGNAMYDHQSYGPTFGGGHDLYTFNGTVAHDGTCYPLNGSTSFGTSYNMKGENSNSICNGNLKVTDLEVYMVEEIPNAPLENPWRRTPEWNLKFLEELKANIEHYKPLKELKIQQARILLVGQVGAGKSSFFNTINSIFRGYITSQACSGNAEHSLTTVYRTYQVRNGPSGKPMNFRLHDTRGLEADQGIDGHEISYIVDGHLPDRHQFNPSLPISPEIPGFITSPQLSDKIHCVAFVMDSSTVDVLPEKVLERIKSLQTRLNQKGSALDQSRQSMSYNDRGICFWRVFYSPIIQEVVDRVSQIMGLPRAHILPLKNYESEMELDDNVSTLALITLQQVLRFADDYMYNYLDLLEEGKLRQENIRE